MPQILSHPENAGKPAADRRPDPHGHRTRGLSFPANPTPILLDETRGQVLDPADASESPAACPVCNGSGSVPGTTEDVQPPECPRCFGTGSASGDVLDNCGPECPACEGRGGIGEVPTVADSAHAGGLLGRYAEALSCGLAVAEASPYFPDVAAPIPPADAADWLSDAGRCELAAVPPLLARLTREAPGTNCRVAVSFGVSRLADGTIHFDRRPGWELTAWRGTETYNGTGHDLERLAACCAARFVGTAGKGRGGR